MRGSIVNEISKRDIDELSVVFDEFVISFWSEIASAGADHRPKAIFRSQDKEAVKLRPGSVIRALAEGYFEYFVPVGNIPQCEQLIHSPRSVMSSAPCVKLM
jgi:hypothetical protein